MEKGDIKFISLTIIENKESVEKFVFEMNSYLKSTEIPLDLMLETESVLTLADLEQHLRACLIKVNTCKPRVKPKEITFNLSIEKNSDGYPNSNQNSIEWMPAEISFHWKQIVPLKSVPMDLFRFNTFIMESSKKGKERCP
ncbi:uncharacterized protein EV154DRAFT_80832 [Mucor mucedo]|uniref:uncharacterized protein n=1 Tax=Mucor mucedo TaxID=29922 RepID=UPI0022206F04|nr:uncharacterized protein EV154DRAFT_80832 [Mucor mucedo]KAI7894566.1 hypothetical protein EV154DRAFT_80832 [Mucor mucedo]